MQNSQIKIGLTGNIGSGKSTVCQIFEAFNVPVYYSDIKAKELIQTDTVLISFFRKIFGNDIYTNQQLDTKKVSEIIFKQKELLQEIENAVHPAVMKDFERWTQNQKTSIRIFESAILFEKGYFQFFDKIIFISAPEKLRIERVMNRDSLTKKEVINRINNQWKEEKKISLCDYVIVCDDVSPVIPQFLNIFKNLL